MCSNHNGIFKGHSARQHHLLLDIDRPLTVLASYGMLIWSQ